jgi:hypothetical protein
LFAKARFENEMLTTQKAATIITSILTEFLIMECWF